MSSDKHRREKRYKNVIYKINNYEEISTKVNQKDYSFYNEYDFRQLCLDLKQELRLVPVSEELVIHAFALVKEAVYRVLGICPYDVQVIAGIAMYQNTIIEMKTGEGKTLAAVFPICLNALSGHKVDVLTANDYLAKRDCEWMGEIYRYFGLRAGSIHESMPRSQRKVVYENDIVYLTVKEAGFDYLKNFLCEDQEDYISRSFDCALIDEADSILIDEARIPLVIAGNVQEEVRTNPFFLVDFIKSLKDKEDYEISDFDTIIALTETGIDKCEVFLSIDNLYSAENVSYLANITYALEAEYLYQKDVDYIVKNQKVYQVDALTGRIAENRQWPKGLQEAIEAKEKINPKAESKIIAQISIENYIKLYQSVSGMTGTIVSSADEIYDKYDFDIVEIPTAKKCIRVDHEDGLYLTREAKIKAVLEEIRIMHQKNRPVLIATSSIKESVELAEHLKAIHIECRILNAKNNELEAGIVAEAGDLGAVTVSTNMAGRGTDIKLGGKNELHKDEVRKLGGLYVIGTNRHNSLRIDLQLRGRAGRQGDCGESKFFISLEDELLTRFGLSKYIPKDIMLDAKDDPIEIRAIKRQVDVAQRIAQGNDRKIRSNITNYSMLLESHRQNITSLREDILLGRYKKEIMKDNLPARYEKIRSKVGEVSIKKAEQQILLFLINQYWTYYLEEAAFLRQTITLENIGNHNPLIEHDKILSNNYREMLDSIYTETVQILSHVNISENGIDKKAEGLSAPSSTLTFLLEDSPEAWGLDNTFAMASLFLGPLLIPFMIYKKRWNQKKKK